MKTSLLAACAVLAFASAAVAADKLATPAVKAEPGFTAKVLVKPGKLYDPLWFAVHGNQVWFNDDGGEEEGKETGSRIMGVDDSGKLTVVGGLNKFLPITGWDYAPASWSKYKGQIFALTQPRTGKPGAFQNHVIERIEPARKFAASKFCQLQNAGTQNDGIAGFGVDARFGPAGSPFADKFYAITFHNSTIYQVTADGTCTPFVVMDGKHYSRPFAMAWTPDHKTMLVTVLVDTGTPQAHGGVVRISPDGKVADAYIDLGANFQPLGLGVAPEGFGTYAGEVFVAGSSAGPDRKPIDRGVFRVSADGAVHLVAGGFLSPVSLNFVDSQRLFIGDIHGDFIFGGVEEPDGSVVVIRAAK